ncbi:MAG: hypothetical protein U9Q69_00800 [Nanoarchaeota archaeon]|nr:hypothetical protein [Nanoarchaeota archaeon]
MVIDSDQTLPLFEAYAIQYFENEIPTSIIDFLQNINIDLFNPVNYVFTGMISTLTELEKKFASNIWQRGREYYREGLIDSIVKNNDIIRAESYGNSTYRLMINLKTKEMECSCPCDFHCKHLAGLIIWLKNNKPFEISQTDSMLKSKSKNELIAILSKIVEEQPEMKRHIQTLDDKTIKDLIRKL